MSEFRGAVVVVPTRNRARIAISAIRSVVESGAEDVRILVSDNSTEAREAEELAQWCAALPPDRVRYVRPPEPLPMPAHWEWALGIALADDEPSHVLYLTDRMIFKPGALGDVLQIARAYPSEVVAYNHDTVLDHREPVSLLLEPWTGKLLEVASDHLLYLSSRAVIHASLPRMLNCVVPREVLGLIGARFGTVFSSISPDFCFAYRCLATVDRILYYDSAPLLQHALSRSNGSSYTRGVQSRDRADFSVQLGSTEMNYAAPVPEFETIRNAILHEYAFVKAEVGADSFPDIDPRGYLASVVEDLSQVEDRAVRRRMIDVLADNGWVGAPRKRYVTGLAAVRLLFVFWDLARGGHKLLSRVARLGPQFRDSEAALDHACRHPRPRADSLDHLEALFTPAGAVIERAAPSTSRPRRSGHAAG